MKTPVSFIVPLPVTASMITSSTAVTHSATEAEWNSATNYTKGTVVFRSSVGRRFENQIPGVNTNPPEDNQDRWYDLGATDKTTMFDAEVSTQSIADGTLTTVFQPGAFNAMHIVGIDGDTLAVTIKDAPGGTVIYSYSGVLEASQPDDYYAWCYSPFKQQTEHFVTDLVPCAKAEVTITVSKPGRIAACGMVSAGDMVSLGGPALAGVTVEPKSYARIATDERGKTSIKKGKAARDMSVSAMVPTEDADDVVDALTSALGIPVSIIATDSKTKRSLRSFGLVNAKLTYGQQTVRIDLNTQGMI